MIKYLLKTEGEELGPFDMETLAVMHKRGEIALTESVAEVGTEKWKPLSAILGGAPVVEKGVKLDEANDGFIEKSRLARKRKTQAMFVCLVLLAIVVASLYWYIKQKAQ